MNLHSLAESLIAQLHLQLVYDFFIGQAKQGGAMAGACFWNVGVGSISDDGYNICECSGVTSGAQQLLTFVTLAVLAC